MESSTHPFAITVEIDEDLLGAIDGAIDAASVQRAVQEAAYAALHHQDVINAALTIVVTTDDYVRALNADYRGIDAPTDVLSFAAQESQPDAPDLVLPADLLAAVASYLGDLVIAYPYTVRQAAHYGNSITAELQLLTVHGVLHLLGFDHDALAAEATMWAAQDAILADLGIDKLAPRTYDD